MEQSKKVAWKIGKNANGWVEIAFLQKFLQNIVVIVDIVDYWKNSNIFGQVII